MNKAFLTPTNYDAAIEKVVKAPTEDWGLIMQLNDRLSESDINADDATRSIVKLIGTSNSKDSLSAVVVLDACFNNCGKPFQTAVGKPLIMDELSRLLTLRANTPAQTCNKIKECVQNWLAFSGGEEHMAPIYMTYNKWKKEGFDFPTLAKPLPAPPASAMSVDEAIRREEADFAAAIAASIKESQPKTPPAQQKQQQKQTPPKSQYPDLYNSGSPEPEEDTPVDNSKYVKGLYTFTVMEAGELGFIVGDVIKLLDDTDANWWKGELNGQVGLFPSNYVKAIENPNKKTSKSKKEETKVEIDIEAIDELLQKLHMAQTSQTSADFNANIEKLYERVVGDMKPLVDKELEDLNKKEEELASLNAMYCQSVALYDKLIKDSQIAVSSPHLQHQPPPQHHQPPMGNPYGAPNMYQQPAYSPNMYQQ